MVDENGGSSGDDSDNYVSQKDITTIKAELDE